MTFAATLVMNVPMEIKGNVYSLAGVSRRYDNRGNSVTIKVYSLVKLPDIRDV